MNADETATPAVPNPTELRRRFYEDLFLNAGVRQDVAESLSRAALQDAQTAEQMVRGLVIRGLYQPRGETYDRVTIADLEGLTFPSDILNQMERMRLLATKPDEWTRLARLFALSAQPERAALCYRTGFSKISNAGPELLVTLAETVVDSPNRPLVLGCIDRVAEIILTGDDALDNPDRVDLTVDDPAGCAVLLDRACRAAVRGQEPGRGASLARAATALFERCGLRHKLQLALDNLAEALVHLGDLEGAMRTIERRRLVVSAESDFPRVASCYRRLAEVAELAGEVDGAARYFELEIQVRESIVDLELAAEAARALGEMWMRHGRLDDSVDAYEQALDLSEDRILDAALARLGLFEAWRAMGSLSAARREALLAREALGTISELELSSYAGLCEALVSIELGDSAGADRVLNEIVNVDPLAAESARFSLVRGLFLLDTRGDQEAGRRDGVALIQRAVQAHLDDGRFEAAASAALVFGHLPGPFSNDEREWLERVEQQALRLSEPLRLRLAVLLARARRDEEAASALYRRMTGAELGQARMEAAMGLAEVALQSSHGQEATRALSSALRTLNEVMSRLEESDQKSYGRSLRVRTLFDLAAKFKESLPALERDPGIPNDATARLSPGLVINGLLASVTRFFPETGQQPGPPAS